MKMTTAIVANPPTTPTTTPMIVAVLSSLSSFAADLNTQSETQLNFIEISHPESLEVISTIAVVPVVTSPVHTINSLSNEKFPHQW